LSVEETLVNKENNQNFGVDSCYCFEFNIYRIAWLATYWSAKTRERTFSCFAWDQKRNCVLCLAF